MKHLIAFAAAALMGVAVWSCGSNSAEEMPKQPVKAANPSGLSDFEMEHGVGPIKAPLTLAPLNKDVAKKGEKIFEMKCYACHRVDSKLVGPPLGDVTKRRKPEYILNMILNPDGMLQKHPEAKKMLAQYLTPMTFQNVTKDDALAILEYLRKEGEKSQKPI